MARIVAAGLLTLTWPMIHLVVFWLRFNRLPTGGLAESIVFLPMSLATATVAVWLWSRTASQRNRRFVAVGYLLASPIAFLGSLLGGLLLPSIWGPLVFGAIPLVAGCYIGFAVGRPRPRIIS